MSRYLLDTNICVHLIKGEFDIKQKLVNVGVGACYLSEVTVAELLFGVENSAPERQAKNRRNVEDLRLLFQGRTFGISQILEEYARQKASLRRQGRTVDEFDLLIGSTAIYHSLTLVTRNTRHFAFMGGIQLENWID